MFIKRTIMTQFNKEDFIADLRKKLIDITKQTYFNGVADGFQMIEKILEREEIPDPISKELLRAYLKEFRKINENNKQKYLNYGH